jgi:hypothetical protein
MSSKKAVMQELKHCFDFETENGNTERQLNVEKCMKIRSIRVFLV